MHFHHWIAVAAAGFALNAPAFAQDQDLSDPFDVISPGVLFKGLIREDDVTLLFKHLRESLAAAARGESSRESEALNRRSEEMGRELAARGSVLMGALLSGFESAAKKALREGLGEASPKPAPPGNALFPNAATID